MTDPTPAATTAGPVATPGQAVLRWRRRGVRALGSLLMAATSIVALAWLILQWGILPRNKLNGPRPVPLPRAKGPAVPGWLWLRPAAALPRPGIAPHILAKPPGSCP